MKQSAVETLVLALTISIHLPSLLQASSLTGTVIDDLGLPVSGASVKYHRIGSAGTSGAASAEPTATVKTGSDGAFRVAELPDGEYSVCVEGPDSHYLNSCDWNRQINPVRLATGNVQPSLRLTLRSGAVLTVRVQDVRGKLAGGAPFSITACSNTGQYSRARLTSSSGREHLFTVAVPKVSSLRLLIDTGLDVTDQNGRSVQTRLPSLPVSVGEEVEVAADLVVQ